MVHGVPDAERDRRRGGLSGLTPNLGLHVLGKDDGRASLVTDGLVAGPLLVSAGPYLCTYSPSRVQTVAPRVVPGQKHCNNQPLCSPSGPPRTVWDRDMSD